MKWTRRQKIAFKEATKNPPDTHRRFRVARAVRSNIVLDLKYVVSLLCEVCTINVQVSECRRLSTYAGTSKGARLPRCVDGRWLREMAVCGPQIKFPKRPRLLCTSTSYSKVGQSDWPRKNNDCSF